MRGFPSGAAFRSPTYPSLISMYQNTAAHYPEGSARRDYLDRSVAVMADRYARIASPPRLHHAKAHMPAGPGWQPALQTSDSPHGSRAGSGSGLSAALSLKPSASSPSLAALTTPSVTSASARPLTADMKPQVSSYAAAVLARPANLGRGGLYRSRMASGMASGAEEEQAPWGHRPPGNAMSPDLRLR